MAAADIAVRARLIIDPGAALRDGAKYAANEYQAIAWTIGAGYTVYSVCPSLAPLPAVQASWIQDSQEKRLDAGFHDR